MTEAEAFRRLTAGVSRETSERFETYRQTLLKWQPRINLVSRSSIERIYARHFLDSTQLVPLVPKQTRRWVDLGSGGGFPTLPCAILVAETMPQLRIALIESDQRKASFLRDVIRKTGLDVEVIAQRIEATPPQAADLITARALSGLTDLVGLARPHLSPRGQCLFMKGARWREELAMARQHWQMKEEIVPSQTSADAAIIRVQDIAHAAA